jgi:uncharacterized protein (TIGR00290 family)
MKTESILISWSGGKDCCLMLDGYLAAGRTLIKALFCTINGPGCLRMHGVPPELVSLQAESLGLPAALADLGPWPEYSLGLEAHLRRFVAEGVQAIAYGDISNHEVRAWRERVHRRFGLQCLFPLWGRESLALAREFIASGYRATVTSVDASRLPPSLAGRAFDESFLAELPPGTDPCGENGEFHTFVHDGPRFRLPVPIEPGPPLRIRIEGKRRVHDLAICELAPERGPAAPSPS